ncbi:TonB-dependent receptor [Vibrio lentus]|nr:TonB-dependent receptor [Vibrio lentus]
MKANRDHSYKSSSIDRSNEQDTYSVFGQVNYPLLDDLTSTTGARYSAVEDKIFDEAIYPNKEKFNRGTGCL